MKLRFWFLLFFGLLLLSIAAVFFWPRSYGVPDLKPRPNTQYWDLKTGARIAYTAISAKGDSLKSPIIYLHGGPGGKITDAAISVLSPLAEKGHPIYFYDQIGSGFSERLEDISEYSVARHRKDLEAITEVINAEQLILVGHSWGCLLAINFAQHHPTKVAAMILDGPGPILPIDVELVNQIPPDSLNLRSPQISNRVAGKEAKNLRSRLMWRWAYSFHSKLASDKEADAYFAFQNSHLSRSTTCQDPGPSALSAGYGYYSHIMTLRSFDEVEDRRLALENLKAPCLILRGDCDNQAWGYAQEYLDLIPNSTLQVIQNSGHDMLGDQPRAYYKAVVDFLLHPFLAKGI